MATKVYFPTCDAANARGSSRYHIVRAVEASLRRLGTDRIDVYYLHRFDDLTSLEETLYAIEQLVRQGKVLYPAVSNFAAWQTVRAYDLAVARHWAPLVCTQPMYNLVKRQAEVEILPSAAALDLAVMPYSPLGGGLLAGGYGRHRRPDRGRLVTNAMYATRYGDAAYYDLAEHFCEIASARRTAPAALGVAWVASHPSVTAPIVGPRTLEQLDTYLQSLDAARQMEAEPALRDALSALSPAPPPATDRNEERSAHIYGTR